MEPRYHTLKPIGKVIDFDQNDTYMLFASFIAVAFSLVLSVTMKPFLTHVSVNTSISVSLAHDSGNTLRISSAPYCPIESRDLTRKFRIEVINLKFLSGSQKISFLSFSQLDYLYPTIKVRSGGFFRSTTHCLKDVTFRFFYPRSFLLDLIHSNLFRLHAPGI